MTDHKNTDAETGAHLLPESERPQPVSPRTEPSAGEETQADEGDAEGPTASVRTSPEGLAAMLAAAIGAEAKPAPGDSEHIQKALASLGAPHVRLHGLGAGIVAVVPSDAALKQVRANFNPSGLEEVNQIKLLSAVLIDLLRAVQTNVPEGGREAAVAITHVQTACMYGVAGVTANL